EIGDNCRVGAKSGLGKSLEPGTDVSGIPAFEHRKYLRSAGLYTRLPELYKRLKKLESEVKRLQEDPENGGRVNGRLEK
ncbi:MAG: UDP-3-O-(3-hydroxymyristoyl)glucosamine N-acyltransferase, partial [Desulfohalobiaceae bacterium]|nr:UDP-3-O-(3-hydroxymyristoyl)glucosamine N-acyltransferase [Desulfohalobiaceae bacterium]